METLASTNSAPANADTAALATPDADANGDATGGEGSAPSTDKAGTPARDKVQERFDELTREKYEARSERDRERYRREAAETELASSREEIRAAREAKASQVAPDEFPTLESVGWDEPKYRAAVAGYFANLNKQAQPDLKAVKAETAAEVREQLHQDELRKAWVGREAEFRKSKPDYDAKVFRDPQDGGPSITKEMGLAIQASEFGPGIVYFLAENTDKSRAIANLPPILQAKEIGRIEAKLELEKAAPKPAVSQAPPPPAKVSGTESEVEKDPTKDPMTPKEFAKWRRKFMK